MTVDQILLFLLLIYVTFSLPLSIYAVLKIIEIQIKVQELDNDIDEIWPDDPDDGEPIIEEQNTNVIAFKNNLK